MNRWVEKWLYNNNITLWIFVIHFWPEVVGHGPKWSRVPMFRITLEWFVLWRKLIGCAFSGWSYIYCTTSDCMDNAWEKITSILNQNQATFSKFIYIKRKYNLFSLISREFYESEMMFGYSHFIWKNKTFDDDRAAVSCNGGRLYR